MSVEGEFPQFLTLTNIMLLLNLNLYPLFLLLVLSQTTKNVSAMNTDSEKEASEKEGSESTDSSEPCAPFNYLEAKLYFIANM